MSHKAEMFLWLSSSPELLLGAAQRVGKEQLCRGDVMEQIPTSGGLSLCKAVVCGRGKMARACKEMVSVVAAQLFLESAQLPPRSSSCVTHATPRRLPKVGV